MNPTVLPRFAGRRVLPALLLITGLAACEEPPPVTVGASASTSFLEAARMALEDRRADGGPAPDTIFIPESTSFAAPALRASERFVERPGMAAVMGHSNSAASLAASQVYNEHRIVQIAPTSTAVVYSEAGPYSFRLVPPDDGQGAFLARVLQDSLPAGAALAVSYPNDDYGRGLRAAVDEAMRRDHGDLRIVLDAPHIDNLSVDTAAAAYLAEAIVAARPDALLWLGRPGSLDQILPTLREALGPALAVYGGDGLSGAPTTRADVDVWRGVRFTAFVDMDATPALREWSARFGRRFPGIRPTGAEALSYDAMALILAAMEDGARTGPAIREWLMSLGRERPPFDGITGPIEFDEFGNVKRPYVLASFDTGGRP